MRFFLYNPGSSLLEAGTEIHLKDGRVATIESIRSAAKFEIVKLVDVDDRDAAGEYRNAEAGVPRDAFPEPDPDEFYLVDLIGFDVYGRQSEEDDAELVGTVDGFLEGTSTEVMVVKGPRLAGRLLVAMIDETLELIDSDESRIVLHPFDLWAVPDETIFREEE